MQPACLFTRQAWEQAGPLRLDLHFCMDLALWLRIAERHRFQVVPDTLAFIHMHNEAKTIKSRPRMYAEIALLLATEAGAWDKGRSLLFSVLDADDTQKRGVKHLSLALARALVRNIKILWST